MKAALLLQEKQAQEAHAEYLANTKKIEDTLNTITSGASAAAVGEKTASQAQKDMGPTLNAFFRIPIWTPTNKKRADVKAFWAKYDAKFNDAVNLAATVEEKQSIEHRRKQYRKRIEGYTICDYLSRAGDNMLVALTNAEKQEAAKIAGAKLQRLVTTDGQSKPKPKRDASEKKTLCQRVKDNILPELKAFKNNEELVIDCDADEFETFKRQIFAACEGLLGAAYVTKATTKTQK
jgi:hypothetical protein